MRPVSSKPYQHRCMITPKVTETARPLTPVSRDTFIHGPADAATPDAPPVAAAEPHRSQSGAAGTPDRDGRSAA